MGATMLQKPDELFLTPNEVRDELHLSKKVLRKMRRTNKGPRFVTITTTTILYYRIDVEDFKVTPEGGTSPR